MQRFEDGSDMFVFTGPHQDPGSAVLDVLQPLDGFARYPDEEPVTVVQPCGNEGMDQLFCCWEG